MPEINKESITKICIDDFAIKKRQRYGTIMIDIETRRVVDLLESRESEVVSEWLKTYPNIQVVSRDGSASYASAINKAHSSAIQVSDRFHLLKNLTEYAKEFLTNLLNVRVEIPATSESKSDILLVKRNLMVEKDFLMKRTETNKEKMIKKIELVRSLRAKYYSIERISEETGISKQTVIKYLDPIFSPVNGREGSRSGGLLAPYHEEIINLLKKFYTYKKIQQEIQKKGYTGSLSSIKMFATRERRLMQAFGQRDSKGEFIERQLLIKLLYNPLEKVRKISEEQVNAVIIKYPEVGKIYEIVHSFKEIIFSKKTEKLDVWLEKAVSLGISGITSFVNGINRDITAVKNAILYEYNNGLAEGSVNKLKVIKRIMYGRNNFNLLRNKLLRLENKRKFN
ncbi:MAG: ISL3 family transposase [Ruminiclostridium sp.]